MTPAVSGVTGIRYNMTVAFSVSDICEVNMTSLLQKAVQKATSLPEDQQNALAAILLEEMESEVRWKESFAGSTDALDRLAEEALEEHRLGRTTDLTELI